MAEISIIIPLYNSGRSIIRCLKSIAVQTFSDYEVIIINDGSTDNSITYVQKFLDTGKAFSERVRVISTENGGAANARNRGIREAGGKYLAFVDQDDFIAKDYFEKYYAEAESSKADIIVGGYERVAGDGRIIFRVVPKPSEWAGYIVTAPWAHLYRRDFIVNKNIEFLNNKIGEDVYYNVVALNAGASVSVLDNKGYKWFYNDKSVSNSVQNTFKDDVDAVYLMDSIYEKVRAHSDGRDIRSNEYLEYFFLRYVCWYMLFSTRGSKKADIEKHYNSAFEWIRKHYPDYRKNRFIGFRKPYGEVNKFHAYVFCFYFLEKLHMMKSVLKMFRKR